MSTDYAQKSQMRLALLFYPDTYTKKSRQHYTGGLLYIITDCISYTDPD